MVRRNQEKADFVAWHMHLNSTPYNKTTDAGARAYYDSLYYRTNHALRAADAASWVALQAAPPAAGGAGGPAPVPPVAPPAALPPAPPPAPAPVHPPAPPPALPTAPSFSPLSSAADDPAADEGNERNMPVDPQSEIDDDENDPSANGQEVEDSEDGTGTHPAGQVGGAAPRHVAAPTAGPPMVHVEYSAAASKPYYDRFRQFNPAFQGAQWGREWETEALDSGSFGRIYKCRQWDDEGKVIDRVAVKESILHLAHWTSFVCHGDVRDLQNRVHMEVHCLNEIARAGGTKNCLQIRGSEISNERMWIRIYTNLCVHQDLWELIGNPAYHLDYDIPEPAIWSIFNDLVNGCLVLEYGAVHEENAVKDWTPIVHRDLKDGNCLLDLRDDDDPDFPNYPRATIADFGAAIQTTDDDPHNPLAYLGEGTDAWRPIEQNALDSQRTFHPMKGEKLSQKTNVWGVGAIIMRLMNRDHSPKGPKYYDEGSMSYYIEEQPRWRNNARAYSKELRSLATACTSFAPADRPTLRRLQREILRYTTPGLGTDRADGMREGVDDIVAMKPEHQLSYPAEEEKYKIGFVSAAAAGSASEGMAED